MKYNVHVYGIVRVKVFNVEAENQEAATQLAYAMAVPVLEGMPEDCQAGDLEGGECVAEFAGYSDEVIGFLVDEVGDTEYAHSRDYTATDIQSPARRGWSGSAP
jgi:hypothetical protein